ncbi:cupin domain-containing protein [Streptomyces blattellae]|uniref:cupin domain-containing protein n=1 Tax=Streptomyces blattellae TaxID=2569855 RepID=UPI0012B9DB3E|nr:cupin domain-containing protein [Streptomyces blattellae]
MKIRRVVTGHSADGKSIVVSDEEVDGIRPALTPGSETHTMWGGDAAPHFPDDGSQSATKRYFPPVGGFRFGFFSLPPAEARAVAPPADLAAAVAEFEANFPGMSSYIEPDTGGMHTTDTIDFLVVVEGELSLELDDGATVHLKTGDTVVQNGTRHGWRNHGTQTARVAVVTIGAHHDNVSRP